MDRLTVKPDPVVSLGGLYVEQGASSAPPPQGALQCGSSLHFSV